MKTNLLLTFLALGFLFLGTNNSLFAQCDTWVQKADFGGLATKNAVGFSINNKGYIGTGNGSDGFNKKYFWEYDPSSNAWTQKADFGGSARHEAVGFSIGNKGYIGTGGGNLDFWEYDVISNSWTQKSNFGGGAREDAVAFSIGTKGYVGTGFTISPNTYYSDFWEYDPSLDSWTQKANFGGGTRANAVGFSIGNKGYIGTGYNGVFKKDFWEYDPNSNTWSQKTDFGGSIRYAAVGFSIGNYGYLATGYGPGLNNDFWEYSQQTNLWTQRVNFGGVARYEAVAFSIGSIGYIGTGYIGGGNGNKKDFWQYKQPVVASFVGSTLTTCNGGNDGTATVTAFNGSSPYSYLWPNAQMDSTATALAAGSYLVTVTDAVGCTAVLSVAVNQPPVLNPVITTTNISCFAANNGFIDLSVSGGTSPYTYAWSSGPTSQDIGSLGPGNYTVTVTDANGCIAFTFATITQPSTLGTSIVKTDVSCSGNNDGTIDLTVSGGTTPYTFNWSNGATTEDLSGLSGGAYNVTVTDFNGCVINGTATINQLPTLMSSITGINPSCSGTNNGQADLDVTGGSPNYTYLWSTGATTQDLTSLGSGIFYVTITDANNCTLVDSVTLTASSTFSTTLSQTNISCFGLCDGDATVAISGGTSPYSISWNTTPPQTTATATGLCGGTFTVNVSDANNCQSTPSVTIVEPPVISISSSVVNADCGSNNGMATISVNGGVSPYSFSWSNGQSDSTATALAAGTYSCTVTDAGGCSATQSISVVVAALTPEICLVTVDSSFTKNLVVWEKPMVSNIDSFRIYREITGTYVHIGSVEYTDLSKFVDTTNGINPNITSYKYKIASVDTCGNVSPLSDFHKTIHLQINGANLTWDNYVGFDSSFYYRILRDTIGLGNLIVMDSVTNSNFTWTDIAPPTLSTADYVIEIVHPEGGCTVTKSSENHNSSRSNKTSSAAPGSLPVADFSGNNLNISAGGNVNFSDLTTNNPSLWNWTFNGGNPNSSTLQNPSNVIYNATGCFDVKLVASNINGSDSITKTCYINVTQSGNIPVADFIASVTTISTGGSVDFLDLSANNPTSWKWLFSGGSPAFSLTQNPTGIIYNNNGCFDVTLISTNTNGSDTLVKSCYISVNPVGINENSIADNFIIVPNPSDGKFILELPSSLFPLPSSIKIYNVLGEVVYSKQLPTNNEQLITNLSCGIYYLQFSSTANHNLILISKKIIVK